MMFAAEVSNQTYNHVGISDAFHPLSHHQNNPDKFEKLILVQSYQTARMARFAERLKAIPDGNGNVLDNSIILFGSNMSNSDRHDNYPVPNLLIGGACGKLKRGGQHVILPERTPLANLHLTVLHKAGIEVDSFADSTGELPGLCGGGLFDLKPKS